MGGGPIPIPTPGRAGPPRPIPPSHPQGAHSPLVPHVVSAGFGEVGGARAGGHCALSAAVGGVRDARIAGYSPATAPMTTVTASPARTTSIGRAKSHPLTAVMP